MGEDAVEPQVGNHGAIVGDRDHRNVIELAIPGSAQLASAAGRGQNVVIRVIAPVMQIAMKVAGNHRIFSAGKQFFDFGKSSRIVVQPQRVVHKHEGPASIGILVERSSHGFDLIGGDDFAFFAGRVQSEEEHVLVDK